MNVADIVNTCRSRGVVLNHDGRGGLLVDGPEHELSDELLGLLAESKVDILAEISGAGKRTEYSVNPDPEPIPVPYTGSSQNIQSAFRAVESEAPVPMTNVVKRVTTKAPTVWYDNRVRVELPAGSVGEVVDPAIALANDPHLLGLLKEQLADHRRHYRAVVVVLLAGRVRVLPTKMVDINHIVMPMRATPPKLVGHETCTF